MSPPEKRVAQRQNIRWRQASPRGPQSISRALSAIFEVEWLRAVPRQAVVARADFVLEALGT